jgi:flagellar hook-associated protein 1 FlgK
MYMEVLNGGRVGTTAIHTLHDFYLGALMGDLLSSATSSLLAMRTALDTTSHNIANANTDGYSRQRVQLAVRNPTPYANGFIGSGVDVKTVERQYDEFMASQSRGTSSSLERLNVYSSQADSINNLFGDAQSGLSATLQKLSSSFQDLSNSPASIPARQVVLSQAQSLVDRFHAYSDRLDSLNGAVSSQLSQETTTISTLAASIADLNQRIELDQNSTGQPPNDLLDQRSHLLDELAKHVNVTVATQDNGQVIVSIGSGQPLVVGSKASTLQTAQDPYDPTRSVVQLVNLGIPVDITARLTGGTVGGLLDFQQQMLDPARNTLGRMTVALSETINAQQASGIDLSGAFGKPLLSVGPVQVMSRSTNGGTGALAVTRLQPSAGALTDNDYRLDYNGTTWTMQRTDTGASVTMTGLGTAASPFVAAGISIVVSGAANAGDSFLVRPTQGATAGLTLLTQDPTEIAAAAPITSAIGNNNVGSARISAGQVLDATNAQLLTAVTIQFTSATQYTVNGGPVQTYTAGSNIDVNGWRVQISGSPAANDVFTVGQNTNPAGDNRNALLLANAFDVPVLDSGTVSINNASSRLIGTVGVTTSQIHTSRDAQDSIHTSDVAAMDSISGVNLDEEAANMIRYQQAYQAAANLISTAGKLFDSVLAALQR